jgi:cell division protein FtsN
VENFQPEYTNSVTSSRLESHWEEAPPSSSKRKYILIGIGIILIAIIGYFLWPAGEPNADEQTKPPVEQQTNQQNTQSYIIVAGLFQHRANAEKLVEKLENHQLNASISKIEVKGKTRYRVYLGFYADKEHAKEQLTLVQQSGVQDSKDAYISKAD